MNPQDIRENADQALSLLKSLASHNRLMILCQLVETERSVGELAGLLGVREAAVSQHLALLRKDGVVKSRRDGQTIHYSLKGDAASKVLHTLHDIYCAS